MKVCDIHCHVLPGLDDGPATLDDTLAMLHTAWEGGTRSVVATPHLYADLFPGATVATIRETFAATIAAIERLSGRSDFDFLRQIELFPGAEHYCDAPFLDALDRDDVLPINNGRCLLVEFPTRLPETFCRQAARRIVAAGYTPVLAHVERYEFVQRSPERLRPFIDLGCVVQANADGSHRFGGSDRLQGSLLSSGLVHVLASDAHGVGHRPPQLGPLSAPLVPLFSREAVKSWTWTTPRAIIASGRP